MVVSKSYQVVYLDMKKNRDVMVNLLDCNNAVSLSSSHDIHFWTNTLKKIPSPIYGLDHTITVLLEVWVWH